MLIESLFFLRTLQAIRFYRLPHTMHPVSNSVILIRKLKSWRAQLLAGLVFIWNRRS